MHEMSYVVKLVNLAIRSVEKESAKVEKIIVSAGRMAAIEPYYMEKYYKTAVKGTVLEGSEIEVETVEVKALCDSCKSEYTPSAEYDYLCPVCGGGTCKIIDGRDVILKRIILKN